MLSINYRYKNYEIAINKKFSQAIENASPVRASSRVIELR